MVYVVQESEGKNITSALKYGEIKPLIASDKQIGFSAGAITRLLDIKLSDFCDEDYLLLLGDPVIIGVAVAIATKWNNGRAKLLKWDRQSHLYYPVSIDIYGKAGVDDLTR